MQPGSAGVIDRLEGPVAEPRRRALTRNQAARRGRVIMAALELAAKGGYEAVQMRDVAARAEVALGTVYRYFSSKDALLAAATIEWMADLEAALEVCPPRGETTAERIMDVLDRVLRSVSCEPLLAGALITALTAGDHATAAALNDSMDAFVRIVSPAFPAHTDPRSKASVSGVLSHVLWSALICWASRTADIDWVAQELSEATHLLVAPARPAPRL